MKLRIKQITLLVAGLTASAVTLAAPVTVEQIDAAFSAGTLQQAWISGASAPTYVAYEGWVRGCDANTNTIFDSGSKNPTKTQPGGMNDHMAYACTRGGKVSVLYHTIDGGSLLAYAPHTVGSAIGRVKFVGSGNGCDPTPLNLVDTTNPLNNAVVYKNCKLIGLKLPSSGATAESNASTVAALKTDPNGPQWPVGGLSDVEASLFPALIGGGINISSKGNEFDVGVGQVFGVAVSIPLYRALQAEQGLTQNDDVVNAPNITSGQYAYLASTGGEANWGSLLKSTNTVNLMRRVDTSGSQSSSNAFFLRNPCNNGVNAQLAPKTKASSVSGFNVTEDSSSSTLRSNLVALAESTEPTKNFAIGVLSLENKSSEGFRYLKLDGVHPEAGDPVFARKTAAEGDYKFHMELKAFVRSDYAGQAPKNAFEQVVLEEMTKSLSAPVAATCAVFPRGLTLNPANGSDCTLGSEVAKVTNLGKNCSTAIRFQ
jgi:hypothetical protein